MKKLLFAFLLLPLLSEGQFSFPSREHNLTVGMEGGKGMSTPIVGVQVAYARERDGAGLLLGLSAEWQRVTLPPTDQNDEVLYYPLRGGAFGLITAKWFAIGTGVLYPWEFYGEIGIHRDLSRRFFAQLVWRGAGVHPESNGVFLRLSVYLYQKN